MKRDIQTGFSGEKLSQNKQELADFIALLQREKVTSYLEIGARHGDTFYEVMCSLPDGSKGVAVDLPGGAWGKASSAQSLQKCIGALVKQDYDVRCILGDSTKPQIINAVRGQYDCILIDGDHRYKGVKADWLNYGPMGRIVAFHDVEGRGVLQKTTQDPVEVPKLWDELKQTHSTLTIHHGGKMGIGVLFNEPC